MLYDIFGDIHGHALELEIQLLKCGYTEQGNIYRHPNRRKAIFVGDFIDRGPRIVRTLEIVKNMCDHGSALAVMGNHEWNAICFHTPHVEKGGFFRDHSLTEIEQHLETLRQFKNQKDMWQEYLDWFKTLPLFLELPEIRVVHACWDDAHINWLKENYKGITPEFLAQACDKSNKPQAYIAIEETLKGKEHALPPGISFPDKDGATRHETRVKWWQPADKRNVLEDVLLHCPASLTKTPIKPIDIFYVYQSDKPVFFGHYWLKGEPQIENPKAVCLDYSVAKGGELVVASVDDNNRITLRT